MIKAFKILIFGLLAPTIVIGQKSIGDDTINLMFLGDIMGHSPQIKSAFNQDSSSYNYEKVFTKITDLIESADFAIGNLELTLAGEPYSGYPRFSSPDELAVALKKSGIDILLTANNHSCDKGLKGILRTINVLDSIGIGHTGTFKDSAHRADNNLMVLRKSNISIGLLNYSYGTNGLPVPKPAVVNLIDSLQIISDIEKSRACGIDKLIVVFHWGNEYQSHPSNYQISLSKFLIHNGVDIIIGSHPHVIQKMEYYPQNDDKEHLIAYSLGNFISNQRTSKRDGGAMLELTISKNKNETKIANCGYHLVWVNKYFKNDRSYYEVVPCSSVENIFDNINNYGKEKMNIFIRDSRSLLSKENRLVREFDTTSQFFGY